MSSTPTEPIDVDRVFSGDGRRVQYLSERLVEEIHRHGPLKQACAPGCGGCERLYENYHSLLHHLVALSEAVKDADDKSRRTRDAFEASLRRAYPKETRDLESNPRVPRQLSDYEPESLGEVLVSLASQSAEFRYESGVRYGEAQVETLREEVARLEARLAAAEQANTDLASVRRAMGTALHGIPDPLVDQLLSGKMSLFSFLAALAGPSKTRLEMDGRAVEVSLVGAAGKGAAASAPPPPPPGNGSSKAAAPARAPTPAPAATATSNTPAAPAAPSAPAPPAAPSIVANDVGGGPAAAEAVGTAGGVEEGVTAQANGVHMTAEQMRRHMAVRMTEGELFSLARLKRAESGLGVDLGKALMELEDGGMVDVVRTLGGDALVLPTDAFRSVVDAAGGEPLSSHQMWASMRNLLRIPAVRGLVAEALCPFLERDYDLMRCDVEKGKGSVWLTLSVPSGDGRSAGLLGCVSSPGPHKLPSLPPYCTTVWVTGDPAHLKDLPRVPPGPAVYYGPAQNSGSDDVWTEIRRVEGRGVR
jgi:hypothetical protein